MSSENSYLIIPGVHKGGTTSLYKYLGDHDRCYAPLKKELHFFTPLVYNEKIDSIETYYENFKDAKSDDILLDVSPSYLYGGDAVINQLKKLKKVKVLLILRNPSKRFVSFYKQAIKAGRISGKETLLEFYKKSQAAFKQFQEDGVHLDNFYNRSLRESCYVMYVEPWLNAFGDDLKIVYFEDLITSPHETMNTICDWLEIPDSYKNYNFSVENQSFKPTNQKVGVLASKIFLKNERFFRKNVRLKNFLKKIYGRLNHSKYDQPTEGVSEELNEFYKDYNLEFNQLMNKYNRKKPNW
jgi:hypothetical protein